MPDRTGFPQAGGLEDRVRSLLAEGRKIEAIKVYRETTGAGLKEAKDAVESLWLRGGANRNPEPGQELEPELLSLLGDGQKIAAIKLYRERTGVGLKQAKDAVELLARRHGLDTKGSGCAGVAVLALGVFGGAIAFLFALLD